MKYEDLIRIFNIPGKLESAEPFGSGHINDTLCVTVVDGETRKQYILQKMNTDIFTNPQGLMDNVVKVTEYLRKIIKEKGGDPARETLSFYPTIEGKMFYEDEDGNCWRMEDLVPGTKSFDMAETPEMFMQTGMAFGQFMADLAAFPADELVEVIPNFHHTGKRFETFESEVKANKAGRIDSCKAEVEFALARKELALSLVKQLADGSLPLRVTHNDTKINNILMDDVTGEPVCIVDLDTIMPGACAYDFGDSIRFGASSAEEDEQDLSKVYMRLDLFEAFTKGYMQAVGKTLTPAEAKSLAIGAAVITFETGIRFLGDHLNGDTYFKIHRPNQNLDRARTQFKLVADMESKMDEMQAIVDKYYQLANA